jgi:hypothetical protein
MKKTLCGARAAFHRPIRGLFRELEKAFKDSRVHRKQDLTIEAEEHRQEQVKGMIASEITDTG